MKEHDALYADNKPAAFETDPILEEIREVKNMLLLNLNMSKEGLVRTNGNENRPKYKGYAVMFMNKKGGRINCDTFFGRDEECALYGFRECYRNLDYEILAVAEVPEG